MACRREPRNEVAADTESRKRPLSSPIFERSRRRRETSRSKLVSSVSRKRSRMSGRAGVWVARCGSPKAVRSFSKRAPPRKRRSSNERSAISKKRFAWARTEIAAIALNRRANVRGRPKRQACAIGAGTRNGDRTVVRPTPEASRPYREIGTTASSADHARPRTERFGERA